MRIEVGHSGPMITLLPGSGHSTVKEVIANAGARLDRSIGRYLIRVGTLPQLAEAALERGVTLTPSRTFKAFLLDTAEHLRATQRYMESVGGDLYPFQSEGVGFLWQKRAAILADEMGLGKTVEALHALPPGEDCAALIVCPGFLAANWVSEAKRWRSDLRTHVVKRRDEFRWPEPGEVVICSYGRLPQAPDKHGRPVAGTSFVGDEGHYLKSYKSQRTRNARKLIRRVYKADGTAWLLTGTPILNRPDELWALLQALELGKTCYGSRTRFIKMFGGVVDGLGQVNWTGKVDPDAMVAVEPYVLRRKRVDVLPDLPFKTRHALTISPPDTALKVAMDGALMEHSDLLNRAVDGWEDSLEAWLPLATLRKALADAKVTDLLLLLPEYEDAGESVVVFSAHRGPVEALKGRPRWGTIMGGMTDKQKQANVKAFQAGELRGLACTIRAAGLGLTLTRAAHAIFVDQDYVPAANIQAEDRLCRIGQTRGVQITRLVCDHKLDHMLTGILGAKLAMLDKTTEKLNAPRTSPRRNETAAALDRIAASIPD